MSPPNPVPDYCEALTGYRTWNVDRDTGLLQGCSHPTPWPPRRPLVAQCHSANSYSFGKRSVHLDAAGQWIDAPAPDCGCGGYAFTSDEWFAEMHTGYYSGEIRVWGTVRGWGRVILHDWGWRAQYAYPGELHTNDAPLAARLATLYGVKVTCTPGEPLDRDDDEDDEGDDEDLQVPTSNAAGVPGGPVGQQIVNAWQQALQGTQGPKWVPLGPQYAFYKFSALDPNVGAVPSLVWTPPTTNADDSRRTIVAPTSATDWACLQLWRRLVSTRCM